MAYIIEAAKARETLAAALETAETAYQVGIAPQVAEGMAEDTERLFTSQTQAYREALVGCVVARCADDRIDIRYPTTDAKAGEHGFSGRSLADYTITPFLNEHAIPVSKSPYLSSLRGGARFELGGAPRIQRDAGGFDALVSIVTRLHEAPQTEASEYLGYLLHRFVVLRETSRINLRRIVKPSLQQLTNLISGLLSIRTGGRFAALLATSMFQTLSDCHDLKWEVDFQGINVADAVTGAVGDITIRKEEEIVLGVEVTERAINRGRVAATFEQKVTPAALTDYLFITTTQPDNAALAAAHNYTSVGHEINFVQLLPWLVNNLATIGPTCRAIFQAKMLTLLQDQSADLKVAWNNKMDTAIGSLGA